MSNSTGYHNNNDNYDYQEGEIFNSPFVRRMKAFFAGGGLFPVYGESYEDHLQNSNISISNSVLWDSPFEREKQANEQDEQLKAMVSQHAVEVREVNDRTAEEESLKREMIMTAAAIETRESDARLDADVDMVKLELPEELRVAANISRITINRRRGSLWLRSGAVGESKSLYMTLQPNAMENTQKFIAKATAKGYPRDVVVHLATYLQKTAFAEIDRLYYKDE